MSPEGRSVGGKPSDCPSGGFCFPEEIKGLQNNWWVGAGAAGGGEEAGVVAGWWEPFSKGTLGVGQAGCSLDIARYLI